MRKTFILNLDERHSRELEELRLHFRLSAEDTMRFAIRLAYAKYIQKTDALVPEFKPRAAKPDDLHHP
tara:strand:+ start:285 stop:488 length:204 start_codon:yes stop_codon:yes gene_type:complete